MKVLSSQEYSIQQRHTNEMQINIKKHLAGLNYLTYICSVFFMVLDLRLTKGVGCRETVNTRFIALAHLVG